MTNWDKFREVFGISEHNETKPIKSVCVLVKCVSGDCSECPIYKADVHRVHFWEEEYESEKK